MKRNVKTRYANGRIRNRRWVEHQSARQYDGSILDSSFDDEHVSPNAAFERHDEPQRFPEEPPPGWARP